MTRKEIEQAKKTLPPYGERNAAQKQLEKELRCREMINSIMVYHGINAPFDEKKGIFNKYLQSYAENARDEFYFLGAKRTIELVRKQQEDFAKAVVISDSFTDSEGCSYNTCIWADD